MVTGEPLFRGRTSEIHRWHDDRTVVKLYPAGEPIERAEHELHNTRTAADQGVRVPAVGNVVTVDGRHGFTMALVAGDSLMDRIENGSTGVEDAAVQLAEVTGRSAPGMDLSDRSSSTASPIVPDDRGRARRSARVARRRGALSRGFPSPQRHRRWRRAYHHRLGRRLFGTTCGRPGT